MRTTLLLVFTIALLPACGSNRREAPSEPSEEISAEEISAEETSVEETSVEETSVVSSCVALNDLHQHNPSWLRTQASWMATRTMFGCVPTEESMPDLFGQATYVTCAPDQLCSVGADGARNTEDDVCHTIEAGGGQPSLNVETSARPGCDGPTQAAVHFFAGLLRGDGSHPQALRQGSTHSPSLLEGIEEWQARVRCSRLSNIRLTSILCASSDSCAMRVAYRADDRESAGAVLVERGVEGWRVTGTRTGSILRHPGC